VLFHIAFQTGFCTLFMRNFIRALPYELIEAARVEGVAEWRIFWFVVLPLMKPAIARLAVLIFTFIWNDYFWAIVLTQGPDSQPVTAGITSFNSQFVAQYHLMSAGSIVAALPPVAMFFPDAEALHRRSDAGRREVIEVWRLDDARQTLVAASWDRGLPEILYWGAPLPEDEDLEALAGATRIDVTGGMMDTVAPMSICPEARRGWPGQPGLLIFDRENQHVLPRLDVENIAIDARRLSIVARDDGLGLSYRGAIQLLDGGLVATRASVHAQDHQVCWLAAPVLPVPPHSDGLIDFSGRWIGEFQPQRHDWRPGIHMREARQGRSGHEHPPFAILTAPGTRNTSGEAWAFSYDWSGGHRMVAEELPDGRRQLQFGHAIGSHTQPGQARTATLTAAYSAAGLNGTATLFQRHIRELTEGKARQPRPVHYNCWEAVYFNQDEKVLRDLARRAAELGAERFVLDDGWFGRRDDDTTSLGDWQADPRKWPDGLKPFAAYVNSLGLGFGLWVEPEMVSIDSALYRARPDWLLGPADQPSGRQQFVLDLSKPGVLDHLFEGLDVILKSAPIEYLKWDHNRLLPFPDERQASAALALIERLRAAHPGLEIESCASGGGRIDLGILHETGRVWLSDSNDALERLRIQHDAALFLPGCVTGSHVGPRSCHSSGRVLDIRFRVWVAASRHLGFEMDPRELTDDETVVLKRVTTWWRANRDWMMGADLLMTKDRRNRSWYAMMDKDGFIHRSWMKNQGFPDHVFDGRPVIGICNTWSELTPCNSACASLPKASSAASGRQAAFRSSFR
jgi:alpha-galactosidase